MSSPVGQPFEPPETLKLALMVSALTLGACDPTCDLPTENLRFVPLTSDGSAAMALRSDGRAACCGDDRNSLGGQNVYGEFEVPCLSNSVSCAQSIQIDLVGSAIVHRHQLVVWGAEDTVQMQVPTDGHAQVVVLPPVRQASVAIRSLALTPDGHVFYWGPRRHSNGTSSSFRRQPC